MQCPVCAFENMPGQTACARCRATLTLGPDGASRLPSYLPPRAGPFRALRPLQYAVTRFVDRRVRGLPAAWGRVFPETPDIPASAYGAMVLSLIPGLGHLGSGRRRAGLGFFAVWAVLLLLALSFSIGTTGWALATGAMACHAVAMFEAARIRQYADGLRARLGFMALIGLTLFSLYGGTVALVQQAWGLRLARCPGDIPGAGIRQGDILALVRRTAGDPRRGDVVTATAQRNWRAGNGYIVGSLGRDLPLWVVALAGDQVQLSPDGVWVNGYHIPRACLPPVTLPLPPQPVAIAVPADYIMVIFPARPVTLPAGTRFTDLWREFSLLRQGELADRAAGIYLPLTRRRFLARSLTE
jgi:hypothetical protein